jgi:hypothetical protein
MGSAAYPSASFLEEQQVKHRKFSTSRSSLLLPGFSQQVLSKEALEMKKFNKEKVSEIESTPHGQRFGALAIMFQSPADGQC